MNRITVTKSRSLIGKFSITIMRSGKSAPFVHTANGKDGAAAKALELALGCGGDYQILGDKEVLDAIRNGGIIGSNKK